MLRKFGEVWTCDSCDVLEDRQQTCSLHGRKKNILHNERLVGNILLNTGSVLYAERQRVCTRVVDDVTNNSGGKGKNQLSS